MKRKVLCGLLCLFLTATMLLSGSLQVLAADEFDALRAKWLETLNGGGTFSTTDPDYASKISQIQGDANAKRSRLNTAANRTYIFSNYQDPKISSNVKGTYQSLRAMAMAVSTKGCSQYGNAAWKADIIKALQWLVTNHWYNSTKSEGTQGDGNNWWDWEIGIPLAAQDILCMLYDDLSGTTVINDYCAAVDHFTPDPNKANFGQVATGANRAWVCGVVMRRGILGKSAAKIAAARDATGPLFTHVIKGDGFYEDGSFIQHSAHPYSQGYGIQMLYELSGLTYMLRDSTWQINNPNFRNVYQWVYQSFEPIIYDGRMFGSGYTSTGASGAARTHSLIRSLVYLSQSAPDTDAAYFKSMIKHYLNALTVEPFFSDSGSTLFETIKAKQIRDDSSVMARGVLEKYKQYNSMDRVYQLRPAYGVGISMFSTRVENYESVGSPGNNRKGWHQGDGWMELANSDKTQYTDNFWPTVDSYRLPGTTVEQNTTIPENKFSTASWVGGTDMDGKFGVTGMQLKTPGQTLSANKGWFMFDDEIVCLGSGITASDNRIAETIVENRKLNSSGNNVFTVNGTAKPTNLGWSETMSGVRWAHLAGNVAGADIGYYFPENAALKGLRQARTGSWADINGGSTTLYTKNYLTLWFDHGSNPTAGSYSYVLLPGFTSTQVSSYAGSPQISILENSADVMAVKENNLNITGFNFWKDISKTVGGITSNKKAAVMVKENAGQDVEVSVCDTTQLNTGTIEISMDKAASSVISKDDAITVTQLSPTIQFSVNVNNARGKSYKIKFSTRPPVAKAWEFNTSTEGWTSNTGISGFTWQTGGYIEGTLATNDPQLKTPDNLGVNISNNKTIIIKMKNGSVSTRGKLYFTTSTDTAWNEAKAKTFTLTPSDMGYSEYTVDMSAVSGWTGTLKQIRLDPIDLGTVSRGTFSIDYVKIQP